MIQKRRLILRNRQRTRPANLPKLRRITRFLLEDLLSQTAYDIGLYLLAAPEMTRLNEKFLRHSGSTDVITFDYAEGRKDATLCGELFICIDEALLQARRFQKPWQTEVVRYLVHGILHLRGHDDKRTVPRKRMKREENRLVKILSDRFRLSESALNP